MTDGSIKKSAVS